MTSQAQSPDTTAYVFEALGSIKAQLLGIAAHMEKQAETAKEESYETVERFDRIHTQIGQLTTQVKALEANYISLQANMNVLTPKVETLVSQRNRVVGIATAVVTAGGAAWWMFGGVVTELAKAIWHSLKV